MNGSKESLTLSERASIQLTYWIGTNASLLVHTVFFAACFALHLLGMPTNDVLLILTTVVSLEAIYLSIFLQMTVNRNTKSLEEVEEDIDDIEEDIGEIHEEMEEIGEDVEEISETIDEDEKEEEKTHVTLEKIEGELQKLLVDIDTLKNQKAN